MVEGVDVSFTEPGALLEYPHAAGTSAEGEHHVTLQKVPETSQKPPTNAGKSDCMVAPAEHASVCDLFGGYFEYFSEVFHHATEVGVREVAIKNSLER